ncbi:MAG: transporter substrate-binding protein [Alicyclobacillaceae bacterium]|nr:transporter substrate-binding protein [Alicyclobacillaceae bacterium]
MTKGSKQELRVGFLFSLTGPTAIIETGQYEAAMIAVEEINRSPEWQSRQVLVPVVRDIASDPFQAARCAQELCEREEVLALVGCYTSACRKHVLPVLEAYDRLLLYPTLYEGLEMHSHVIYCGPTPNQQLRYFVPWMIQHFGKRIYVIGSEYIYPLETNRQFRMLARLYGGRIVKERYVPLGTTRFEEEMEEIARLRPDMIFSTLVGVSVPAFYEAYARRGFRPETIPICSPITSERENAAMSPGTAVGHYACHSYFQSVETDANRRFIRLFRQKRGEKLNVSAPMEYAYVAVHLLAEAVCRAECSDTDGLRRALQGLEWVAPEGLVRVDPYNYHLWCTPRIGRANAEGQFDIVWESRAPLRAEPLDAVVTYEDQIVRNWERFVLHKQPLNLLNKVLVDSWQRSRQAGVDPFLTHHPRTLSTEERELRADAWKMWLDHLEKQASPYVDLFPGAFLVVADQDRVLLSVYPESAVAELWTPGVVWTEEAIGTNAIDLALKNEALTVFRGPEHFCALLHRFCVVAVPVSKPLKGVIALVGIGNSVVEENVVKSFAAFVSNLEREIHAARRSLSNAPYGDRAVRKPQSERAVQPRAHGAQFTFHHLVGRSQALREVIEEAKHAARTEANILILGESGTGKELLAHAIHNGSLRRDGPFVAINCAAIPKNLIESELFGYVEGAFTGAKKGGKIGKFEAAHNGTLFLDEVGELPLEVQAALLRALQQKEIVRVGDHVPVHVNVRIIAATNRDLQTEIAYKGTFRADLYFRLNVFELRMPPLRERLEDIPDLVRFFLDELGEQYSIKKHVTPAALQKLMRYSWPGNIRELRNVIERAYHTHPGQEIDDITLPGETRVGLPAPSRSRTANRKLDLVEKETIYRTLMETEWNISYAAKILGISRTTLYRKIKLFHLTPNRERSP